MKKKRIYKKYLTMNPLFAYELYSKGKISYEKYMTAFYSSLLKYSGNRSEEALIKLIY